MHVNVVWYKNVSCMCEVIASLLSAPTTGIANLQP